MNAFILDRPKKKLDNKTKENKSSNMKISTWEDYRKVLLFLNRLHTRLVSFQKDISAEDAIKSVVLIGDPIIPLLPSR